MAADGGESSLRSLTRALELLTLFERADAPTIRSEWIVSELALPRTTVYRLLRALRHAGFIQNAARGEVRLGTRLRRLAELAEGTHDIGTASLPELQRLVRETGESAFVATRVGKMFRYAAFVESPQELRVSGYVGKTVPLHAAATGKLLLAFAPPNVVDRLLEEPLQAFTVSTVTDRQKLRAELARIRELGFAVSSNEANAGSTGISVPLVYGDEGDLAALTLIGPDFRLNGSAAETARTHLLEAASRLAERLSSETSRT
jgi:DNA-binding IclR family transcriptional regulator